jgi:hypothetical protein
MARTGSTRRARLTALTACAAAAILVAGCAAAVHGAPAAAGRGARTLAADGQVHFIDSSVNSDGPYSAVIVTGAIGDYGRGLTVRPDGTGDPGHTGELELRLTEGSFRLEIARLDQAIVHAYAHWPSNQQTCSGSITVTAATPIVAGSGTGLYTGIGGTLTASATIDEVDVKPVCNGTSRFRAQVILITGSGTVTQRRNS